MASVRDASRKIPLICSGHSRPVPDLSYSPLTDDGFFLASACLDGKPMLRNGQTGDWIGTFLGHKGAVWSAHINSAASQVVTGSADYTAKIWNALTGDEVHSFPHSKIVKSVHFSQDNKKIATGCQDKVIRIFDLDKLDAECVKLEGHLQPIKTVLFTNQPHLLLTAAQDSTMRVWDLRTLQPIKTHQLAQSINGMEISLDQNHIASASGKQVSFWNSQTFELEKTFTLNVEVNSVSVSPKGDHFVTGGTDFWVRLHDMNDGKELEVHKGHHGPVHCVKYAPDGATFASGSEDGTIRILQSESKSYGLWQETEGSKE